MLKIWTLFWGYVFRYSFMSIWVYRATGVAVWRRVAIREHCRCLWQTLKWSLVRPVACINEWTTVGPTNLKPLLTMSLLIVSDFDVFTGTLCPILYCVEIGLWFTKPHMYLSNDPNSLLICNPTIRMTTKQLATSKIIYKTTNIVLSFCIMNLQSMWGLLC